MGSREQEPNAGDATPATAKGLRLSPVPVERFDEYVVVARLGRGGMAEVILGLSQGPQGFRKLTAIKRLHTNGEQDPELARMFLHEAAVSALLEHPNVVQTYKVGEANGRHFMAMEYLEGQPLHRALSRLRGAGKGLELVLAARIASDALAGLASIHDATTYDGTALGLVHRDVSPQNLFITYDGQVKLLDFGIAKVTAVVTAEQTRPGLVKGKLAYIAPEQAHGRADRRADVWSVGVILWEALTGRRLFRGESEAEKLRALLNEQVPRVRSLRADVPAALEQIVMRALEREQSHRYASATEMKSELDAWLSTQPVRGGSPEGPIGRSLLASLMQTRFADAISERRAAVLSCLSAVEHEERWKQASQAPTPPVASARSSVPSLASVVGGEAPAAESGRGRRVLLFAVGAAAGALLLLLIMPRAASPKQAAKPAPAAELAREQRPTPPVVRAEPENPAPTEKVAEPSVAAVQAVPAAVEPHSLAASRASTRSTRVRSIAPAQPVPSAEQEPARESESSEDSAPVATTRGRLRLDASPYAVVSLEGKRLGITPIDVELPAATHTLTLRNPERGIETTYRVEVLAGQSLMRRVELE